jgi:hypothetical protein
MLEKTSRKTFGRVYPVRVFRKKYIPSLDPTSLGPNNFKIYNRVIL